MCFEASIFICEKKPCINEAKEEQHVEKYKLLVEEIPDEMLEALDMHEKFMWLLRDQRHCQESRLDASSMKSAR